MRPLSGLALAALAFTLVACGGDDGDGTPGDGDGGTMIDGVSTPCGCARCTGGPATGGTCCDCGTSISPRATRCRSCRAKHHHAQRTAQMTGAGAR